MVGEGRVTASVGEVESNISVKVLAGELHEITFTPPDVTLVAGTSMKFEVRGFDKFGNEIAINPSLDTKLGTIYSDGYFDVKTMVDSGNIVAVQEGIYGEADIIIIPDSLFRIEVYPAGLETVPNVTEQLSASGYDKYGNPIRINPVWDTTVGAITGGGLFTAQEEPGIGYVTAKVGDVKGKVKVNVLDRKRPSVVMHSPDIINHETERDVDIVIVFSEPINKTSMTKGIEITPFAFVEYSWNGNNLILYVMNMKPGTTYTLSLNTNITDMSDNPLMPFYMQFSPGIYPGTRLETNDNIHVTLNSPAHLLIVDSGNRRTGYFNGTYVNEIPGAEIINSGIGGHEEYILYDISDPDGYSYIVSGTQLQGDNYGIQIEFKRGNKTLVVAANKIWIEEGQTHRYVVNWEKVEAELYDSVGIGIDTNGDTIPEAFIHTNSAPSQSDIDAVMGNNDFPWLYALAFLAIMLITAAAGAASRRSQPTTDNSSLMEVRLARVYCEFCGKEFSYQEHLQSIKCPLCGMSKGFYEI